jgi:hypothetical protein
MNTFEITVQRWRLDDNERRGGWPVVAETTLTGDGLPTRDESELALDGIPPGDAKALTGHLTERLSNPRAYDEAAFRVFLGAAADLLKTVHGVAEVAELDGDEVGYLVARVAEIKRQR